MDQRQAEVLCLVRQSSLWYSIMTVCIYILYMYRNIHTRAHSTGKVTTKTKREKEKRMNKAKKVSVAGHRFHSASSDSHKCGLHFSSRHARAHTQTPYIVESPMHTHTHMSSNRLHFADIPSHCSERGKALAPHTAPLPCPQKMRKAALVYYLLVSLRTKFSVVSDVHSGSSFGTDATLEHSAGEIGGSGGATSLGTK